MKPFPSLLNEGNILIGEEEIIKLLAIVGSQDDDLFALVNFMLVLRAWLSENYSYAV